MSQQLEPYSVCVIVPCFNHGATIPDLVGELSRLEHRIIIVDDGSSAGTATVLDAIAAKHHSVRLCRHPFNLGKRSAVHTGLLAAREEGFTHAIQIDADRQHDPLAIPTLETASRRSPLVLVSGKPVYDHTVPGARRYGRWITHFWVWIETLTFAIEDSMCGFRVYPVDATLRVLESHPIGARMEFDTEIMVRLYWEGVPVQFIPVSVTYPTQGISHFRPVMDNVRISWMHTRLVFGMFLRIPKLVRIRKNHTKHWSITRERRGMWGMRLLVSVSQRLGMRGRRFALAPVVMFYWLTGGRARRASEDYLKRIQLHAQAIGMPLPHSLNSYRHFLRFAESALEKLTAWKDNPRSDAISIHGQEHLEPLVKAGKGAVILGAHLGNFELCRIVASRFGTPVNAIVFTRHAARFNQLLRESNPNSQFNLIQADDLGPDTAIRLKEKLGVGEWVGITADRTSAGNPGRVVWAPFLGSSAPFPQSPFIFASALREPVFLMFAIKENSKTHIYIEPFSVFIPGGPRRRTALDEVASRFAKRLEHYCLRAPLDWFNFYPFWSIETNE